MTRAYKAIWMKKPLTSLTLILRGGWGGANMPHSFSNAYTSGTECRMDLKPGCKFKLVRCLKVYKKNLPIRTIQGPWRPLFMEDLSKLCFGHNFWSNAYFPNVIYIYIYIALRRETNLNYIHGHIRSGHNGYFRQFRPFFINLAITPLLNTKL